MSFRKKLTRHASKKNFRHGNHSNSRNNVMAVRGGYRI